MKGKVSVIIPLYNREQLVIETLQSVKVQTYDNFECIVIDDGSNDNSMQSARTFCQNDSRFIIEKRISSIKGACVCRNEGIDKATGQYLMFLDSDDLLSKECIEQRVWRFEKYPEFDFIVNQVGLFRHSTSSVDQLWSSLKHEDDVHAFVNSEGWQTSSTFFKTQFVKQYRFDARAMSYQDVDFHLRVLLDGPSYKKFPDSSPDVFIRVSNLERISNRNVGFDRIESRINVYSKLEKAMDEKGYYGYLRPYSIYHLKFLEIAALLLPYRDFRKLFSMWKTSKTFSTARSRVFRIYLFIQATLSHLGLRWISAALYRVIRLFVSKKLLYAQERKIPLAIPIKLVETETPMRHEF